MDDIVISNGWIGKDYEHVCPVNRYIKGKSEISFSLELIPPRTDPITETPIVDDINIPVFHAPVYIEFFHNAYKE